jgi:hypothetical protein
MSLSIRTSAPILSFGADDLATISAGVRDAFVSSAGSDASAVVVVVPAFEVTAGLTLLGPSLDAYASDAVRTTLVGALGSRLGNLGGAQVTLTFSTASPVQGEASFRIVFSGLGSNFSVAEAVGKKITELFGRRHLLLRRAGSRRISQDGDLTSDLVAAGIPVSGAVATERPTVGAVFKVTVIASEAAVALALASPIDAASFSMQRAVSVAIGGPVVVETVAALAAVSPPNPPSPPQSPSPPQVPKQSSHVPAEPMPSSASMSMIVAGAASSAASVCIAGSLVAVFCVWRRRRRAKLASE